jgi:hypothetical protein
MQVYSVGLYTSRRISIQIHYILWKHPIHRGGAMRLCTTLIDLDMQDRGYELRRILLPRIPVNSVVWYRWSEGHVLWLVPVQH